MPLDPLETAREALREIVDYETDWSGQDEPVEPEDWGRLLGLELDRIKEIAQRALRRL